MPHLEALSLSNLIFSILYFLHERMAREGGISHWIRGTVVGVCVERTKDLLHVAIIGF